MTTYRQCRKLSTAQAAYIAGLIDGEGTITLTRKHRNEQRQLAVTISSTERPIVEFVLEVSGVGKVTTKRKYRDHHLPSYTYATYNRQALALLDQTTQYLRSYKTRRAEMILANYLDLTPRNGKYNEDLLVKRRKFEEEFFQIRSE